MSALVASPLLPQALRSSRVVGRMRLVSWVLASLLSRASCVLLVVVLLGLLPLLVSPAWSGTGA